MLDFVRFVQFRVMLAVPCKQLDEYYRHRIWLEICGVSLCCVFFKWVIKSRSWPYLYYNILVSAFITLSQGKWPVLTIVFMGIVFLRPISFFFITACPHYLAEDLNISKYLYSCCLFLKQGFKPRTNFLAYIFGSFNITDLPLSAQFLLNGKRLKKFFIIDNFTFSKVFWGYEITLL